jgi:hypothetical protein
MSLNPALRYIVKPVSKLLTGFLFNKQTFYEVKWIDIFQDSGHVFLQIMGNPRFLLRSFCLKKNI